ncbi:hypothetical protein E2C01_078210 [Portunus trituberculatus]|uniref:Uncharacterized protein n=1 Tax=Portunus trituberculatus TaxID=210409 RepID=A0A5B7IS40_PORTR|nr:hypothetical protein [Portunus trituberculatus]
MWTSSEAESGKKGRGLRGTAAENCSFANRDAQRLLGSSCTFPQFTKSWLPNVAILLPLLDMEISTADEEGRKPAEDTASTASKARVAKTEGKDGSDSRRERRTLRTSRAMRKGLEPSQRQYYLRPWSAGHIVDLGRDGRESEQGKAGPHWVPKQQEKAGPRCLQERQSLLTASRACEMILQKVLVSHEAGVVLGTKALTLLTKRRTEGAPCFHFGLKNIYGRVRFARSLPALNQPSAGSPHLSHRLGGQQTNSASGENVLEPPNGDGAWRIAPTH